MAKHRVAALEEIPPGTLLQVEVAGLPICLAHAQDCIYAIADTCTHEGAPLSEGILSGVEIECPWHSSRFSLTTGEVCGLPAEEPVRTFTVSVDAADIYIEVDDS